VERDFIELCIKGDLIGAQQLLQLHPNINISAYNEQAFVDACNYGHLEVCKWLLQVSKEKGQDINISDDEDVFHWTCANGHLDVCQWLLQIKPDIDISINNELAFRYACANGHLDVCQWLLQVKPTINVSIYDEEAFRWACADGRLDVCQWLLQVKPTINISFDNEEAFRVACIYNHLHVAQWLKSLKPYLYVIEYDEDGKIKGYRIREKEDANWQRRKYLVWLASNKCPEENKSNLLYKLPSDVSRLIIGFV
jgi:ankyrin repeat protein